MTVTNKVVELCNTITQVMETGTSEGVHVPSKSILSDGIPSLVNIQGGSFKGWVYLRNTYVPLTAFLRVLGCNVGFKVLPYKYEDEKCPTCKGNGTLKPKAEGAKRGKCYACHGYGKKRSINLKPGHDVLIIGINTEGAAVPFRNSEFTAWCDAIKTSRLQAKENK